MKKINNNILPIIFLMGPTSSGKSLLALQLYNYIPIEIISVDSILVYKDMNIGSDKPTLEQLKNISYKLIDICNINEIYSIKNFYFDAIKLIHKIISKKKIPVLVGGSMLYFNVLFNGLFNLPQPNNILRNIIKNKFNNNIKNLYNKLKKIDPIYANLIHKNDTQRIIRAIEVFYTTGKSIIKSIKISNSLLKYKLYKFAIITNDRKLIHKRIEKRFYKMLDIGFENEVKNLLLYNKINLNYSPLRSIGYKEMISYLMGDINYNIMIYKSICSTRQLAKKQMTWINKWKNDLFFLDMLYPMKSIKKILKIINL